MKQRNRKRNIKKEQEQIPKIGELRTHSWTRTLILIVGLPRRERTKGYVSTTEKMPRRRIRARYEQLSEFEKGCIIGLKEAGWEKIGKSLVIWVKAMQLLEDASKNGGQWQISAS
ncbi:hypothetical protein TNCV_2879541 [Trichonephila clavipes]|uniref:Uncharacterized protein n=1 Tax=Trichonephila clavipes TaxID=2585209 RepID=A0A8X7BC78_TRICX|nr:hypothetical protein TNCV_2879541 [Trichonephila clavipes]